MFLAPGSAIADMKWKMHFQLPSTWSAPCMGCVSWFWEQMNYCLSFHKGGTSKSFTKGGNKGSTEAPFLRLWELGQLLLWQPLRSFLLNTLSWENFRAKLTIQPHPSSSVQGKKCTKRVVFKFTPSTQSNTDPLNWLKKTIVNKINKKNSSCKALPTEKLWKIYIWQYHKQLIKIMLP